jgi:hypothetical protein
MVEEVEVDQKQWVGEAELIYDLKAPIGQFPRAVRRAGERVWWMEYLFSRVETCKV